jgi:hypothetical protein
MNWNGESQETRRQIFQAFLEKKKFKTTQEIAVGID